jgi:hypothetical protein
MFCNVVLYCIALPARVLFAINKTVTIFLDRQQKNLFNNTIIVQVRYIIIETKEVARIGYNGFLFPHSYSGRQINK